AEGQDQAAVSAPEAPTPPAGPIELTWQEAVELIDQITGIGERAAQGMLAELGKEMGRFASAKHLASWAGVCPGNHESAGKRLSGKTWPREFLVAAASSPKCPCRRALQEHLFGGAVSPHRQSPRTKASRVGSGPQHPGDH